MKVLFINTVCGIGSTGRICEELARRYDNDGHIVKIAYGRGPIAETSEKYAVRIGNDYDWKFHALKTRLFDTHGFESKRATKEFLQWVDDFHPDLIWLHNLHGYYINIEMLFMWIKAHPKLEVKWTLHDCWAFTGHCTHFSVVRCVQWKNECVKCIQKDRYPKCIFFSNVNRNFLKKKDAFTGVKNLTIITPSEWLASLIRDSFLKDYPVQVHYNHVDRRVFKPTPSNFRDYYNLNDKFVILGVANVWDDRKGLNDFYKLACLLDDRYIIVLVGLNNKQICRLPDNIIGITRTNNPKELAAIYSAADIFVNPSREETFGMTSAEAIACGTKSIVYKDTACEEIAIKNGGIIVDQNVYEIYRAIIKCEENTYNRNNR